MTTYRLMDGVSGRPGVGSTGTQPPTSVTTYSGNYIAGLTFKVTQGGLYFNGWWFWCPTGGDTGAPNVALWQVTGSGTATLIPAATISSTGGMIAGQWNFIPCVPLPLTPNVPYIATIGFHTTIGFPDSPHEFGSGEQFAAGITNGPLTAYSSLSGSLPLAGFQQSPSSTAGLDPSYYLPTIDGTDDLLWLDVQVTDQVPFGTPEHAWPNLPVPYPAATPQSTDKTLGMEFTLTEPGALEKIWHYAPYGTGAGNFTAFQGATPTDLNLVGGGLYTVGSEFEVSETCNVEKLWVYTGDGAASLPDAIAIYEYGNTTPLEVNTSPTWSGALNSGWVYVTLSGTTQVSPGTAYYAAIHYTGGGWPYGNWSTTPAGVSNGPLSMPGTSGGRNGQGVIDSSGSGSILYPGSNWSTYNALVDVTVTPTVVGALPSRCGIWNTSTQAEVAGTDNSSPTWLNPDGSTATGPGWVYADYSQAGITLAAGTYQVSTFSGAGSYWYAETAGVFGTGNPQNAGFTQDVLQVPGGAAECSANAGAWGYPATSEAGAADWIDVEVVPVPATSFRLMDGMSGRPGNGPTTAQSYSGNWIVGTGFTIGRGNTWFEGYWYWVCPTGGLQQVQKFALWQVFDSTHYSLVPNSTVTSPAALTTGWNYVPLATPIQLSVTTSYVAATGVNGNFAMSDTSGVGTGAVDSFGTGGHTAGIRNGPLFAYSAEPGEGGTAWNWTGSDQALDSNGGTDPSVVIPLGSPSHAANLWLDVQVTTTAPSGYSGSYRVWPGKAYRGFQTTGDSAVNYVVGTEIHLSTACTLNKIWYCSPGGTAQLATEADVWNISTGAKVASVTSPTWSGAAGSGWVSCSFTGITLPAGRYYVTVFNGAATPDSWSSNQLFYTSLQDGVLYDPSDYNGGLPQVVGVAWDGIRNGPVYMPSLSNASSTGYYQGGSPIDLGGPGPGQAVFAIGPAGGPAIFPNQYVKGLGQTYWVDMEVTPTAANAEGTAGLTGAGQVAAPAAQEAGIALVGAGHLAAGGDQEAGATLTGAGRVSQPASTLTAGATLTGRGTIGGTPAVTGQAGGGLLMASFP